MARTYDKTANFQGAGECGLDARGVFHCDISYGREDEFAGRYRALRGKVFERFATSYYELCAADSNDKWTCIDNVAAPDHALEDAVITRATRRATEQPEVGADSRADFELQGIDAAGRWTGLYGPLEGIRHDFVELAPASGDVVCGLRKDDTVHCRGGFLYDDDRLNGVTRLTSGRAFIETELGTVGKSLDFGDGQRKGYGQIFAADDPRNNEHEGFIDVQHGNDFGCGLKSTGRAECWGKILGSPVARPPRTAFESFAMTGHTACGITRDTGTIRCWSRKVDPFTPGTVPAGGGFVEFATSYQSFCARRDDDAVFCWGGVALHEHPFELPFKTKSFTITDSGVCGIRPQTGNVECFGTGYRW
jgi:hypothetical protein